jgi:peptide/nickel transport system substrate-binding protein
MLLATVAGLAMAGVADAQAPKRGGELRVAVGSEPNTTDCHAATTFTVIHHVAPHYSFLVRHDPAKYPAIMGDLAKSWTTSPDGLEYRFTLHEGVKFHDGGALTAKDVQVSFERIRNPPQGINSPRRAQFADVTAIEAPDAATVVFRLKGPDPSFLSKLAGPYNCVFSAAKLAQDPRYPEKEVMGSGPFVFVERKTGVEWVGRRFDGYFRQPMPYLDGFRNVLLTGTAMLNALQGGQVDAEFRGITPAERDRLKAALGDKMAFQETPWLSAFILSFNTEKKPFDDVRVRRALHMALDRWGAAPALARVAQVAFAGGLLRPGYDLAATESEAKALPGMSPDMAANRAAARRLLAEAGVPNLSFKLHSRPLPPYPAAAVFLIDQWRQIGVAVEQQSVDTAQYFSAMTNGAFDVVIDFTTEPADEPNIQWNKFTSMDRAPPPLNSARFTDRKVDELFDRQSRELDPGKRRVILRELETHLLDQAYMVPIFWFNRIIPHTAAMKGWQVLPSHLVNQSLAEIWLDR